MTKKCTDCSNCLLKDYGYSNWTVEGTEVICMLGVHPDGDFDRWYGEDKRLLHAEKCDKFVEGDAQTIDVEHEDFLDLSEQAQQYIKGQ